MEYNFLKLQISSEGTGKVANLELNKPPVNALSSDFLSEIAASLDYCIDEKVEVVIFRGSEKAFIAGADIAQMKDMSTEEAGKFAQLGHDVMNKIESSNFLSVAVLKGFALGGGLELALACNIRYAAKDATLGLPETSLGLIPGFGGTYRLAREIGTGNALHAVCSAAKLTGERAYELGLVQKVCSLEEMEELVEKEIAGILRNGPKAIQTAKNIILGGHGVPAIEALKTEKQAFAELFTGAEAKEGMTAFLEKRKAGFRDDS